jgi:hypothetical protein
MASELQPAVWNGPFAAQLADMTMIYSGDERLITAEDLKSSHWKAVKRAKTSDIKAVDDTSMGSAGS